MEQKQEEAETLFLLGDLHMQNKHYEEAVVCFEKGLSIIQETGDKGLKWKMYVGLASSKKQLGLYEEGIQYCKKALEIIAKINGSKQQEAETLQLLGELHMKNKQFQEAVTWLEKGLPDVKEIGDRVQECQMNISLGASNANLGQYEQAIQYLNEALDIAQTCGLKQEEIENLGLLGDIYIKKDQYKEAVDCHQKGLPLAQKAGDKKQEHTMCIGLGEAYRALGHCSDSMKYSEMALDIAKDIGDSDMIAISYLNLGMTFLSKCDYQNAIKYLDKAIDMSKQLDNELYLAQCYDSIASVYSKQGKYYDAIRFQKECLEIAVNSKDEELQATTLITLGNIYYDFINFDKAFEVYLQSLAIAEKIGNKTIQKFCYANLASLCSDSSYFQAAYSMFWKSLEFAEELGDKKVEAGVISNIGRFYHKQKEFEHALQCFNESLTITNYKDIDAKDLEASVYLDIGRIHFDTEKFEEAISMYEIGLDISSSIGDKETEWRTCSELGRTYYSLSHQSKDDKEHINYLSKSEQYLRQALCCYDYLFTHLRHHDQFKISKFDQFTETYNLLTSVLIETKQKEEALLVSDQGRARALGDQLKLQYGMSQSADLSSKPLTYPDVESVVSNDAFTLLHYSLLNESLVVWILSKDSIKIKGLNEKQFVSAVELLYAKKTKAEDMREEEETCENRSLDDCMTITDQHCDDETECVTRDSNSGAELNVHALKELYNTLIAPVISDVQHDEIVVVPDGKMYTVPFAALKDLNTGKYLSQSKRIRLVPSIAVLKLLQECTVDHHSQQGALIVGNPIGDIVNMGEKKGFCVKLRGKEVFWPTLNHARKEASEIREVFTERSGDVQPNITLLTETRATKDVVLEKMKEGTGVIHIAAHGDADFGEIVMAPITSQDRQGLPEEHDYLLTMTEVQEVGVKAQLVVLSCCHTGRGEIRAEGMIGLSRAFIAAGARAVVASLWAINSKATRKFMVKFYKCLCDGHSASVSLNMTMKYLREYKNRKTKTPMYSEPKYWAPFVLIGDDVTVKFGH